MHVVPLRGFVQKSGIGAAEIRIRASKLGGPAYRDGLIDGYADEGMQVGPDDTGHR